MNKIKFVIFTIFLGLILILIEMSLQKDKEPDYLYDYLQNSEINFSNEDIKYIRNNKIKYHDLKPYLEFETFNLYNFLFYEDIRTKHNLTHLEALNTFNHPDYFSVNRETKLAFFQNTSLILVNKQYFIDKDYIPDNLVNVSSSSIYYVKRDLEEMYLEKETLTNYEELYQNAIKEGLEFVLYSGYRDYQKQKILYYFIYEENEKISAKPGHSEHQTGLAIDISTLNDGLTNYFAGSKEFIWLKNNAHRFGFILRFPEDKEHITGYSFEPWHFRYVGKKHAEVMYQENLCLEEYLFKYFELK